jgi:hypothetical protein
MTNERQTLESVTILAATGATDFFDPPLEQYKPPRFISPQLAEKWVLTLKRQQLILLGGDPVVNKHTLARHVAWFLQNNLAQTLPEAHLPILEWKRTGSEQLDSALHSYEEGTIFILPQLLPLHIGYDVRRLYRVIKERGHYVVVTAEEDARWNGLIQAKAFQQLWVNINRHEIYTPQYLCDVLEQRIIHEKEQLPQELITAMVNQHTLCGHCITDIAKRLKTPDNIEDFVSRLMAAHARGTLTEQDIQVGLEEAEGDESRIRLWFHLLPGLRQELLVLALNFFDGLLDDQFFSATEALVEGAWQHREPSLEALDYYDFDRLQRFFRYVRERDGDAIKTQLEHQRRLLFKVVWTSHRRHILSALPICVQLIQGSVASEIGSLALFGTSGRRDRIRKTLSETISDIGLCDGNVVEETLLRLGSDRRVGVQAVAGRAVARWYEFDAAAQVYATLTRWMGDETTARVVNSMVPGEASGEKPHVYLRATVALAVGYTAQSCPPNAIPQPLYDLLNQLADEPATPIRTNLSTITLPMILPLHLNQVNPVVVKLARYVETHRAIARSMVDAFKRNPTEVQATLDGWFAWCMRDEQRLSTGSTLEQRNALLACIARTYGFLPVEDPGSPISVRDVFTRMKTILAQERPAIIRAAAMNTSIRKGRIYFHELELIVAEILPNELKEVLSELMGLYLKQRTQLLGGDTTLKVEEDIYPIWVPPRERPLTEIEKELFSWIQNPKNPVAQQIAVRAMVEFREVLGELEQKRIDEVLLARKGARSSKRSDAPKRRQRMIGLHVFDWFIHYIVAWIVTLRAPSYRRAVRGALPEVLFQHQAKPQDVDSMLEEWSYRRVRVYAELGRRLRSGLWWAGRRFWIGLVATIVGILVLVGISSMAGAVIGFLYGW